MLVFRLLLQAEKAVGGDAQFRTWQGWYNWFTAGRNNDVPGGIASTVDIDGTGGSCTNDSGRDQETVEMLNEISK